MKIALGTAQFGLNYGIVNKTGQIDSNLAKDIIDYARGIKINTLDTAIAYGNSHKVLSKSDLSSFKVVSKLPSYNQDNNHPSYLEESFYKALEDLQLESIYGFMFHSASDLFSNNGMSIFKSMIQLKEKKLIKKVGVSIYNPNDLGLSLIHI